MSGFPIIIATLQPRVKVFKYLPKSSRVHTQAQAQSLMFAGVGLGPLFLRQSHFMAQCVIKLPLLPSMRPTTEQVCDFDWMTVNGQGCHASEWPGLLWGACSGRVREVGSIGVGTGHVQTPGFQYKDFTPQGLGLGGGCSGSSKGGFCRNGLLRKEGMY